jgi:signal transduction histidine kinase/HAMP domain-containing protein
MRVRLRVSIGRTIFGAFVAMGLLLAALGAYGLYVLGAAGGFVVELYDGPLMALNFDRAASLDFVEMDKELIRRARAPDEQRAAIDARIDQLARAFREDLAVAAARSRYDDEKQIIKQIGALVARWHELRRDPAKTSPGEDLDQVAGQVTERFDMLAELAAGHSFVERRKVMSEIGFFRASSIGVMILALLLSGLITLILVRRIIRPLRDAASLADRIAEGELQAPIPAGRSDETGQLLRSMAVMQQNIRDMVEREKAGRRSAQNRLVDALENSDEAIVLVDALDRIVIANSRLADFFPELATQLSPGTGFSEVFQQVEALMPAAKESAQELTLDDLRAREKELLLADGRWLRISRSRTREGGFILVLSNISAIKNREDHLNDARRQAEAASEAKTTFLANMSHELRTPLNAIIGFSEVMGAEIFGKLGSDAYVEYAKDIQACGTHLLAIINSVLDLSKSEAGKLELACECVDLGSIIDSAATMVRDQCARAGLELYAWQPIEPIQVWGDPAKLRQVLLNLLSNAMKFTPAGGSITVRTELRTDDLVSIEVADSGIGMAPEDVPTALAAFGQIDTRVARRYDGTGLGLPLSKAIIELHGGLIAIDSAPGLGTKVKIILPREAVGAAAAAA